MLWRLLASHMREHKCQMPCRMNVLFVVFADAAVAATTALAIPFFPTLITRMLGIFLRLLQIVAAFFSSCFFCARCTTIDLLEFQYFSHFNGSQKMNTVAKCRSKSDDNSTSGFHGKRSFRIESIGIFATYNFEK